MTVYVLWEGDYEALLEGIYLSLDRAKDHMNEIRKSLKYDPLTWKEEHPGIWKTKMAGILYTIEEQGVK